MSELKILIHIGHHLNVVNLLGACTKAGGKKCSLNIRQRRNPSQIQWYFNVFVMQCPSLMHTLLKEAQGVLVLLQIWPHHMNGFWNFSPDRGVTSLSFFSFSFVSSLQKRIWTVERWDPSLQFSALVFHMGTIYHFKGACALLLPLLPCHVRRMHQAKRYWRLPLPKQFTPARQRQSKAEWSSSMDFQGAELTWLAVHHAKIYWEVQT